MGRHERMPRHCKWRLKSGRRAGLMCGVAIDDIDRAVGCRDYCLKHTTQEQHRQAKKRLDDIEAANKATRTIVDDD